jgi:hypothetical protein
MHVTSVHLAVHHAAAAAAAAANADVCLSY